RAVAVDVDVKRPAREGACRPHRVEVADEQHPWYAEAPSEVGPTADLMPLGACPEPRRNEVVEHLGARGGRAGVSGRRLALHERCDVFKELSGLHVRTAAGVGSLVNNRNRNTAAARKASGSRNAAGYWNRCGPLS